MRLPSAGPGSAGKRRSTCGCGAPCRARSSTRSSRSGAARRRHWPAPRPTDDLALGRRAVLDVDDGERVGLGLGAVGRRIERVRHRRAPRVGLPSRWPGGDRTWIGLQRHGWNPSRILICVGGFSVDVEHGLARDAAVEQGADGRRRASRQLPSWWIWVSSSRRRRRAARAARGPRSAAAAPPELREDVEAVDRGSWRLAEQGGGGERDVGLVAAGERDDRAERRDPRRIAALSDAPPTALSDRPPSKRSPSAVSSCTISSAPSSARPLARSALADTAVTWAPPRFRELDPREPADAARRAGTRARAAR